MSLGMFRTWQSDIDSLYKMQFLHLQNVHNLTYHVGLL